MLRVTFADDMDIRGFIGEDSKPWFVAKDVCGVLGIRNPRDAVSGLDSNEKGVVNSDTPGGNQRMAVVNESGLYNLTFKSKKKPEAQAFQKWVTETVLPAIRRTGGYFLVEEHIQSQEELII